MVVILLFLDSGMGFTDDGLARRTLIVHLENRTSPRA
jgi:hypothetical protein